MRNVLIPQGSEQTAKEGRDREGEEKLEKQREQETGREQSLQASCLGSVSSDP